jgi:methionyl-tRNA formyltransferase
MKLIFAGTPGVAADVLRGLVQSGHEVVTVLTREDAPVGRHKILTPSEVAAAAYELGIPVLKANRIGKTELDLISNSAADLGVVVAYGSIFKPDALTAVSGGWYNLHFSLLPKYRGAAPVQRALQAGERETGVTMFKLDEGMDTGPVVGFSNTSIGTRENSGDLLTRLGQLALNLALEVLPSIYSGTAKLTDQVGNPTFATKPTRDDSRIDFSKSSSIVEALVRAMNPEPMAWCLVGDEPMRVLDALEVRSVNQIDAMESLSLGQLYFGEGKLFVRCGEASVLELLVLQPSSKRGRSAKDWFNGNRTIERLS